MSPTPTTSEESGTFRPEFVADPPAAPSLPRRRRVDPLALLLPGLLLTGWWATVQFGLVNNVLLPSPSSVGWTLADWLFNISDGRYFFSGTWWRDLLGSLLRVGIGFTAGSVLAIVVGLLVGWFRIIERIADPTIQVLRPIPKTAFLPFAILLFGLGNPPALFLTIYGVFLIVYVQVVVGVKLVPRDLKRAAAMLGAQNRAILLRVVLPAALPNILTGMRVGAAYAWLILILAEMLAVREGFGYVLWHAYEFLRMDAVVASMLWIGLFGYLTDKLVVFVMRRKLAWAQAVAETQF